ncbi:MAG: transmembrane-type terpene cyclase [Aggregatilineales bacterium]
MLPQPLYFALLANFDLFWLITYALMIRRAFKDKTYAVPFVALAANTAWDFFGSFVYPSPYIQVYFNLVYLVIDLTLLYQVLRFWRSVHPNFDARQFYALVALAYAITFTIYFAAMTDLNDQAGVKMAWIDTFIDAILFIGMFFARPALLGQSLYIGLGKVIGTGSAVIAVTLNPIAGTGNLLTLPVLYIWILTLNVLYAVLVYHRALRLGINPWRRF